MTHSRRFNNELVQEQQDSCLSRSGRTESANKCKGRGSRFGVFSCQICMRTGRVTGNCILIFNMLAVDWVLVRSWLRRRRLCLWAWIQYFNCIQGVVLFRCTAAKRIWDSILRWQAANKKGRREEWKENQDCMSGPGNQGGGFSQKPFNLAWFAIHSQKVFHVCYRICRLVYES